jgi:regulator of nonsense transcripts 2
MEVSMEKDLEELITYEDRKELRRINLEAQKTQKRPDESFFCNLDSSLKKNISFVRKLKTLSYEQREVIWKEAIALKSDKYIGEIVSSLLEAKLLKQADFTTAIEVSIDLLKFERIKIN